MTLPCDALDAGLRVAATLAKHGIPYALGGALAYGQYGIPRATNDVDVNVFIDDKQLADVFTALRSLGISVNEDSACAAARREGLIVLWYGQIRLDVFVPSIDFSWEAANSVVTHDFEGDPVTFLSVEALCVFKLLFFRAKDLVDLERLIAVQGDAIDTVYVRRKIVEMLQEDDPRVATWDKMILDNMPEE